MIIAVAGSSFTAWTSGWDSGLVGTIEYRVRDGNGNTTIAPTSSGVVEDATGSGLYRAPVTLNTSGGYVIEWTDDGSFTAGHVEAEDILVAPSLTALAGTVETTANAPGSTIQVSAYAASSLSLGVTILDAAGETVTSRSTTGITESADPNAPGFSVYTTTLVLPGAAGSYTIKWDTGGADPTDVYEQIIDVGPTANVATSLPTVKDVGELLLNRTVSDSVPLGTFTAITKPTADQVQGLIRKAADRVTTRVGPVVAVSLASDVRTAIALRAAMMVEASAYPQEIRGGYSAYPELAAQYAEAIEDLDRIRRELGPDETIGTQDDTGSEGLPSYSFPPLTGVYVTPGAEQPFYYPTWPPSRLVW